MARIAQKVRRRASYYTYLGTTTSICGRPIDLDDMMRIITLIDQQLLILY
jgi:hypothetical protein